MKTEGPKFIRITDLAEEARVHTNTVERYLLHDIIQADATVKHGRNWQPIFLQSRLKVHLEQIRKYRQSLAAAAAN